MIDHSQQQFDTNATITATPHSSYSEPRNGLERQEQTSSQANHSTRLANLLRPTHSAATISFVFGVLGICFTLPLVGSIIAIVTGYTARRDIRQSKGQLGGERLALAGLIMGGISLGLTVLIGAIFLLYLIIKATKA